MTNTENKHDPSSQIFEMVKNNLPEQNNEENSEPVNGIEFFLWMLGIACGLFLLRYTLFPLLIPR